MKTNLEIARECGAFNPGYRESIPGELLFKPAQLDAFAVKILEAERQGQKEPVDENVRIRNALEMSRARWRDIAAVIRDRGKYDNAMFADATADRCDAALAEPVDRILALTRDELNAIAADVLRIHSQPHDFSGTLSDVTAYSLPLTKEDWKLLKMAREPVDPMTLPQINALVDSISSYTGSYEEALVRAVERHYGVGSDRQERQEPAPPVSRKTK